MSWTRSLLLSILALVLVLVCNNSVAIAADPPPPLGTPQRLPLLVHPGDVLLPPPPSQQLLDDGPTSSPLLAAMMARLANETVLYDIAPIPGVVRTTAVNPTQLLSLSPDSDPVSVLRLGVLLPLNLTLSASKKFEYWLSFYGMQFGMLRALRDGLLNGTTIRVVAPNTFDLSNPTGKSAAAAQFLLRAQVLGAIGDGTPEKSIIPADLFALAGIPMCSPQPSVPPVVGAAPSSSPPTTASASSSNLTSSDDSASLGVFYRPVRHLDLDVAALLAVLTRQRWRRIGLVYDESKDDMVYLARALLRLAPLRGITVITQTTIAASMRWTDGEERDLLAKFAAVPVVVSMMLTYESSYFISALDRNKMLTPNRAVISMMAPAIDRGVPVAAGWPKNSPGVSVTKPADDVLMGGNSGRLSFYLADQISRQNVNILFMSASASPFRNWTYEYVKSIKDKSLNFPADVRPKNMSSLRFDLLDEAIACGYTLVSGLDRYLARMRTSGNAVFQAGPYAKQLRGPGALSALSLSDFNRSAPGFWLDQGSGDYMPFAMRISVATFAAPTYKFRPLWVYTSSGNLRPWTPSAEAIPGSSSPMGAEASTAAAAVRESSPFDPPVVAIGSVNDTLPLLVVNPQFGQWLVTMLLVLAGLGVAASIGAAIAVMALRHHAPVRASTPLAGVVVCTGSLLMCLVPFTLVGTPSPFLCHARAWLVLLGMTLGYAALLAKMYRIYKVFHTQTINHKVTTATVVRWTVGVTAPQVLLLLLYSGYGQPQEFDIVLDVTTVFLSCRPHDGSHWIRLVAMGYDMGLAVAVGALAIRTRNVYHMYNESQLVALVTYNDLVIVSLLLSFTFAPGFMPHLFHAYMAGMVYLGISKLLVLLGPMFVRTWQIARAKKQRHRAAAAAASAAVRPDYDDYMFTAPATGADADGAVVSGVESAGSSARSMPLPRRWFQFGSARGGDQQHQQQQQHQGNGAAAAAYAKSPPRTASLQGASATRRHPLAGGGGAVGSKPAAPNGFSTAAAPAGTGGAGGGGNAGPSPDATPSIGVGPRTLLSMFATRRASDAHGSLSQQLERIMGTAAGASPPGREGDLTSAAMAAAVGGGASSSASDGYFVPLMGGGDSSMAGTNPPYSSEAAAGAAMAAAASAMAAAMMTTDAGDDEDVVWAPVPACVQYTRGWRSTWLAEQLFGYNVQWRHATVVFARSDGSLRVHWGHRVLAAVRGSAYAFAVPRRDLRAAMGPGDGNEVEVVAGTDVDWKVVLSLEGPLEVAEVLRFLGGGGNAF
ncbi:7 transmembrane sweet-taste receptor of 3 GCPR-domain-containing protein [Blastocladiella britannica]|nr:7 transmembrane sweet-taste receptor of 3 GCPR-domain-containing protein [Blastocladiella britannica]